MIRGELATMPLYELLQWAEWHGRAGRVVVERDGGSLWLCVADRRVVAVSPLPGHGSGSAPAPDEDEAAWLSLPPEAEATERLLDLFLSDGGVFAFEACEHTPEDAVRVDLQIRHLVHEGMRHRDEWPEVDERYPDAAAALRAAGDEAPPERPEGPFAEVLLRAASHGLSLGEVRTGLSISRPALLRRVHELVRLGALRVEGSGASADPMEQLTLRATQLAEAGRYEEARHLLETLLAAAPTDTRLEALLEGVGEQHLAFLRQALPERAVLERVTTRPRDEAAGLTATEREVYERVKDGMTVGALLLTSPLREVDTLRTVEKMVHLELFELVEV